MKKFYALIAIVLTALNGCVSIDYSVPEGTKTSPVTISTNMEEMKNIKIRYQGVNSCERYPGNLMAMINSATVGIDGGSTVEVLVPADEIQVISVMGAIPLDVGMFDVLFPFQREQVAKDYEASLRELYFAFIPKFGYRYNFEFNFTGEELVLNAFETGGNGVKAPVESLPLPSNCKNNRIFNI